MKFRFYLDQVSPHAGIRQLLEMIAVDDRWECVEQIAYFLATVEHETARQYKPITEYGQPAYFAKYAPGTKLGKDLGNTQKGDGVRYKGRGFVQLTGRANYAKLGKRLFPKDPNCLVDQPDLATHFDVAYQIAVVGMFEGSFTGRAFKHYINPPPGRINFIEARRIINGTDKAYLIADYANSWLGKLQSNQVISTGNGEIAKIEYSLAQESAIPEATEALEGTITSTPSPAKGEISLGAINAKVGEIVPQVEGAVSMASRLKGVFAQALPFMKRFGIWITATVSAIFNLMANNPRLLIATLATLALAALAFWAYHKWKN